MRTPYWLADEESLKLVQEVKNLIDSKMHTKDLILKLVETHGHTLTNDFVDDIRERMELESLTSGMMRAAAIMTILFTPNSPDHR